MSYKSSSKLIIQIIFMKSCKKTELNSYDQNRVMDNKFPFPPKRTRKSQRQIYVSFIQDGYKSMAAIPEKWEMKE